MKKIFTSILLLVTFIGYAQTLSQEVINDYAHNSYLNYEYGNGYYKSFIYTSLRSKGYTLTKVEMGMENLKSNYEFREATFEAFYRLHGSNENLLFAELKGINMTATNANALTNYIINKYGAESRARYKKEELRREKEEKIQKEALAKREKEEAIIRSKIYDLSIEDTKNYKYYKDALLESLITKIQKSQINSALSVNVIYNYSYVNKVGSITEASQKLELIEGNSNGLFDNFSMEYPPACYKDDLKVPVKFEVQNIKLNYSEGITQVKVKNKKIIFKDSRLAPDIKNHITNSLKSEKKGRYEVAFRFGHLNEIDISKLDKKSLNKSGNWLYITIGTIGLVLLSQY